MTLDNQFEENEQDIDFTKLFPETKFRFNPLKQLRVVKAEVDEAMEEVNNRNKKGILIESIDIIHSTFTLMYNEGYTNAEINQAIRDVQNKNRARGYYEE